jgi:hypothetical protein
MMGDLGCLFYGGKLRLPLILLQPSFTEQHASCLGLIRQRDPVGSKTCRGLFCLLCAAVYLEGAKER